MNIDKWLADTISSIKTTDPSELMRKMEEYGLVEDDRDAFCGSQGMLDGNISVGGDVLAGDISGGDILDPTPRYLEYPSK